MTSAYTSPGSEYGNEAFNDGIDVITVFALEAAVST